MPNQITNAPGGQQMMDGAQRSAMPPSGVSPTPQPAPTTLPTQPIETPAPATPPVGKQPTVVTSDPMREVLAAAEKSLMEMKRQIDAGEVTGLTPSETDTKTKETPLAKTETPTDPEQVKIDLYKKESQNRIDQTKKEFDKYLARSSSLLRSQTKAIQQKMDVRRNQADQVAEDAMAASKILGGRTGRSRYAPELQRGIITGQENALIETLAELDAIEAAAIADAQNAAFERDYGTFLDKTKEINTLQKEREIKMDELSEALEEENKKREELIKKTKDEAAVIDVIVGGKTSPIDVYNELNGAVPYDFILEYTKDLPSDEPIKLGSGETLVDPNTGRVIAFGSKAGRGGGVSLGGGSVGNATSFGNSITTVGAPSVQGLGATYATSSEEAQLLIEDIVNGLPTQLINNVAEIPRWRESVRKQLQAGYTPQQVIDKLSGFRLFEGSDKNLGTVFYNMLTGTDVEPQALSDLMNRGAKEQAMTLVENSQLKNTNLFFASLDDSKAFVGASERAAALLADPNFPTDFLGTFDGRKFKAERFLGKDATETQRQMLQQLETQLAILNAPTRVSIAGTAATPEEMAKINAFQADIYDNPETMKEKLSTLTQEILAFHNAARTTRGLPSVTKSQLLSNAERLKMYTSLGKTEQQVVQSSMSNTDFLNSGSWAEGSANRSADNASFFSDL